MPKMHLRQPRFTYSACGPFFKTKKEYKNLKKQEILDIFIRKNQIKPAFNMISSMEILGIFLEEQLLINYYVIMHLTLLKIQNMMGIKEVLLQWFISFLIKSLLVLIL